MFVVNVLIADDHDFFRRSILFSLEDEPAIAVAGIATSGDEAVRLARALCPDVILMDLNMPYLSGVEAMERIILAGDGEWMRARTRSAPAILVLTGVDDAESVLNAFAAGARGYLRKDMITDRLLVSAILTVASGGVFIDAHTFALLKSCLRADSPRLLHEHRRLRDLTPGDRTLLRWVALGYDNDQISHHLQVTRKTVSNRLSRLYLHLGVANRVQLANFALRTGFVDIEETV